jgi:thymidylate kinase
MPIICFFGPDGSGKSTIAGMLLESYRRRGARVRIGWMRGTHTVASILARLLLKRSGSGKSPNPFQNIKIPSKLKRVWQLVEFFSALPVVLRRFVLPSLFGSIVLAERYTIDYLVWVSQITDDNNYISRFDAKFFLALALKTSTRFYVTAKIDELAKRSKLEKGNLRVQLCLYNNFAYALRACKIDTTQASVDESLNVVLSNLSVSWLGERDASER